MCANKCECNVSGKPVRCDTALHENPFLRVPSKHLEFISCCEGRYRNFILAKAHYRLTLFHGGSYFVSSLLLIIAKKQERVIFKSVQKLRSWSLAEQAPVCKGCNCGYGPSCPINTAVHPVLNTESLADGHHLSPSSPEFAIWKQKKPRVIFQAIYGPCSPDSFCNVKSLWITHTS